MLSLDIQNEIVYFRDIKPNHLPEILRWYNNVKEYRYATGINMPISIDVLMRKYAEVAISSNEFFVGIYTKCEEKMIGILKGSFKYRRKDAMWIRSIVIDTEYQNKGYGRKSIELLLEYFKSNYKTNSVYLAVAEENLQGRRFWSCMDFKDLRKMESHMQPKEKKQNIIIMYRNT